MAKKAKAFAIWNEDSPKLIPIASSNLHCAVFAALRTETTRRVVDYQQKNRQDEERTHKSQMFANECEKNLCAWSPTCVFNVFKSRSAAMFCLELVRPGS